MWEQAGRTRVLFAVPGVRLPVSQKPGAPIMHGEFLFLSVLFLCFIDESCKLSCADIVSKRLGLFYRSGRSPYWVKIKNPTAPVVMHETEEDWGL
jgi:hypothetical protein